MKNIVSTFLILLISIVANSQNAIDKYFSAYENNSDFTVVSITPKMFKMIANSTTDSKDEVMQLIKDITGLKILVNEKEGVKYYNEAIKKIPLNDYELLMSVKDNTENVRFMTKGTDDRISELLLLIGGKDNFVLMSFVGNLDLAKIAKLANKLDLQGSEHLSKLKNRK
jgi:vacuolar-type H+-ATPase subunit F/Vma7